MMSPLAVLAQPHEQAASHPQYDASGPGPLTAKPRAHGWRGLTFNAVSVCDVKRFRWPLLLWQPRCPSAGHRVQMQEEFAHDRHQGDLARLASLPQAPMEVLVDA